MRWSKSYIFTLKETPADAEIPSHQLLVRGGYIKKVAQGIFTYGPLALRSIRKFENIVREELNNRNCIEVLMPMVQPRELWDETNRWQNMGKGLLKFKNRLDQDFCLGATHEEVITDLVRHDVKSYRDLPFNLYQIQTKYRDEIRPRFGLMRGREFIMKDAYSFDQDSEGAIRSYKAMYEAYAAIFKRLGVKFVSVKADSGNIGGSLSEEFHILAESGEDALLVSQDGQFAANVEVCPAHDPGVTDDDLKKLSVETINSLNSSGLPNMEKFATPGLKSIEDLARALNLKSDKLVKTMFYSTADESSGELRPICVLLRGSDEVNPIKLKNLLGLANPPLFLTDVEVKKLTGSAPGSCGPIGLQIPIYMDFAVAKMQNYTVGANEEGFHFKNVSHGRDYKITALVDLRMAKAGDQNPAGAGVLQGFRGIEVGHIFYLGNKYSKAMNASFLNEKGESLPIEMGCYGIGISRTVQAVIEQCHDKDGIVWPVSIAPFAVHLALLDPKDEEVAQFAEELYQSLNKRGIDCLMDDRDERPGVKFKDADLLGMPLRVNIGRRGVQAGEVEVVQRATKAVDKVPLAGALDFIIQWHSKAIEGAST